MEVDMSAAFITWEFSRTTVHKRRLRKYLALALAHLSEKLKRYKELCGLIQKPLKKCQKENHQVKETGNILKFHLPEKTSGMYLI